MNDSMSILLATTVLALGGLGLYMYKSSNEDRNDNDENNNDEQYNEENIFGSSSLFNWTRSDDKEDTESEQGEDEYKPRRKNTGKTQTHRNRKSTGSSKRRY